MYKNYVILGLAVLMFSFVACGKKSYDLAQKPIVTFKTTIGEFKIALYQKAAPKASLWFVKFVKEGRYKDTNVDEVVFPNSLITIGYNGKVMKTIDENFVKEVADKDKKIEKNEILFRSDNEAFGLFSIYVNPSASESDGKVVIFGKVIEGEDTLAKLLEVRVDSEFRPVEPIKIVDVQVAE